MAYVDIVDEIARLKRERNAVILAHYYQESEIQDLADFLGDSLALAKHAQKTDADVIVLCGVRFMAETAKVLNPGKTVLLPDLDAGCSLADGCPASAFAAWRAKYPDHAAVSYINCSVEVKALSDVICTSSNAVKIVKALGDRPILFAPDRNLGRYLEQQLGKPMRLWPSTCIVHETFSQRALVKLMAEHPDAEVIAHPECEEPLLRLAHFVGSTSALLARVAASPARTFIVATESGILHQMRKAAPDKELLPLPGQDGCGCNECPHMKRNTLEKLRDCLRDLRPAISIEPELLRRARRSVDRMMELGASA
ncbi:MAG: quinolinate synthase NadA [Myxococcota bacterium]